MASGRRAVSKRMSPLIEDRRTCSAEPGQFHITTHGAQGNLVHMALEADVAAHSLRLGAAVRPETRRSPLADLKYSRPQAEKLPDRSPLVVLTDSRSRSKPSSSATSPLTADTWINSQRRPGQIELHVGGGQAPEKEEGRAGGLALADRQDSLIGDPHFQLVHVALQPDAVVCSIQQVNGHIAVDCLDVHPPQALRGNGAA